MLTCKRGWSHVHFWGFGWILEWVIFATFLLQTDLKRSNWIPSDMTSLPWSGQLLHYNHLWPFSAQAVGVFDWRWDVWRSEAIHPLLWHSSQRANLGPMKKQPFSALIFSTVALAVWAPCSLWRARRAIHDTAPIGDYLCFACFWWCAGFFF